MVAARDELQQIFVAVAEYHADICLFAVAHCKDNTALLFMQLPVHTLVTPGAICLFHSNPLFYLSIRTALLMGLTQQLRAFSY